jgi:hypothetical protein
MEERRKEERLKDENEIAVTLVDDEKNPVQGKNFNNHSMDISVSGAKIKSNILLPVGSLIMIKMKLKNMGKMITTIGKVKWTKGVFKDKSYEAGVKFIDTPIESIFKLEEYISQGVVIHRLDDK